MGGSLESPVSRAWMWPVSGPKHSSMASKPLLEPNRLNQGVQMWAGMKITSGAASRHSSRRSWESRPRMGLPSLLMLPRASRRALRRAADSKLGKSTRLWTLRVLPPRL
jgi:hypothetical protein